MAQYYNYYSFEDYDFVDVEQSVYDDIKFSDDPTNILNASMLRHYANCHGITPKLKGYLNLNCDDINAIIKQAKGNSLICSDIPMNAPDLVANCRKEIKSKKDAIKKNERLVGLLKDKRDTLCGIGTKRVKLFLNKQIKQGDTDAKLYRLALEAEDRNITAKSTCFPYQEKVYNEKKRLIIQLANECRLLGLNYGYQKCENYSCNYILYFELPNMEQISFHTNLTKEELSFSPQYNKEWDKKECSTLHKIEETLSKMYFKKENV